MKILLVKLSSLGDVVHTLPVVQDIHSALPGAQIDWVVERAFAPLPALLPGVRRVLACDIRRWRKSLFSRATRLAWRAFCAELQAELYDVVIDLQGLTKSAVVARLARLAPGGQRFAMAHATDGSGYEAPTRWLADVALPLPAHIHAVARGRMLAALALGYPVPKGAPDFGLAGVAESEEAEKADLAGIPEIADGALKMAKNSHFSASNRPPAQQTPAQAAINLIAPALLVNLSVNLSVNLPNALDTSSQPVVVWVHGSSRADKCWPTGHWLALGLRLHAAGWRIALVHGNAAEEAASRAIAMALNAAVAGTTTIPAITAATAAAATVWPRLPLAELTRHLARAVPNHSSELAVPTHQPTREGHNPFGNTLYGGVIGVDSGVSHIATALGLPQVQLYNFNTAWRTGPLANPRQISIYGQPVPSVEAVWQAWLKCSGAGVKPALASSNM